MSNIKLNSSGGGSVTLTAPSIATNISINLPATNTVLGVTTANVLTALASSVNDAVGSYAMLQRTTASQSSPGATLAGSSLRYAGLSGPGNTGGTCAIGNSGTPSGTWRCMGFSPNLNTQPGVTLWLRIS